jgi:phage terminase large subunit
MLTKRVKTNKVYKKYYNNQSRFLIFYGGAGSGKSVFVTQKICRRFLSEDNHKFLVIRNTATSIKDSVYQELLNTLRDWGQLYRIQINKSEHRITLDNGNEIICKGLDDEQKIKSISGITGMWIEEATELKEDAFDQLNLRIRGEKDNYIQYILSFNPISEDHWLKRRFIDTDSSRRYLCSYNLQG